MPQLIPFIPLITAGIGGASALYGGYQSSQQNKAAMGQANQATQAQQALIQQLMSGINPESYREQARVAGEGALSQLAANFGQRGMLSSGALHTAGANTLSQLYADAGAKYQQDRMNAIGMALGGQQSIQQQYGRQINPDPYSGLGAALGAFGTAGANYLGQRYGTAPAGVYGGGNPLPGFGVRYPR